jgi:hypothetical protein
MTGKEFTGGEYPLENMDNGGAEHSQEMILGMYDRSELMMFIDDPDGYLRFVEFVEKLIDNLFAFASTQYRKRVRLRVIAKLAARKKMEKQFVGLMPGYLDRLKVYETDMMRKFNINKGNIKN